MGQACSTCAGNDQNEIETKVTQNVAHNVSYTKLFMNPINMVVGSSDR